MMNVILRTDIVIEGQNLEIKAGDSITVDTKNLIAYHAKSDSYFDILKDEFVCLN